MKLSYSAFRIFRECPRQWFYKYLQKPEKTDQVETKWGDFGTVVHSAIENISKFQSPEEAVNHFWLKKDLQDRMIVHDAYACVKYGLSLGFNIIKNEETLNFKFNGHDFISFIDATLDDGSIADWKTSTFDVKKVKEYKSQLLFYSWAYWRTQNKIPPRSILVFLKPDKKSGKYKEPYEWSFSKDQIIEFESELIHQMNLMFSLSNLKQFEAKAGKPCFFCPWKKRCWSDNTQEMTNHTIKLICGNKNLQVEMDDPDPLLYQVLEKEFMYEMDNSYFAIKAMRAKGNLQFDGKVRLFKNKRGPIAFKHRIKELLKDYSTHMLSKGKRIVVEEINQAIYPNVKIEVPESLEDIEMRKYQNDSIQRMIHDKIHFSEICTGAGKTIIAAELIRKLAFKTLFVVDVSVLLQQTKDEFEHLFKFECGTITEGEQNWKGINIATIQTVRQLLKKKNKHFIKELHECNLVIVDEAHGAKSKSYQMLMDNVKAEYRIGLTGTAYADGNATLELNRSFGFVEHKITTRELINEGFLIEPEVTFIKYNEPEIIYGDFHEQYSQVLNSDERLKVVTELVNRHKDDFILIVCRHLEHVDKLMERLKPYGVKKIIGEVKPKDRDKIIAEMKAGKLHVIIGTEKIVQKGLNIPNLNVGINYVGNLGSIMSKQFLGRILRKCEGKTRACYYDFFDTVYDLFGHTKERIKHFETDEYVVKNDKIYK